MTSKRKNIFSALALVALLLAVFIPSTTHAAEGLTSTGTSLAWLGSKLGDVVGWLVAPVVLAILKLTAFILLLSGIALNAVVYYTIILMAKNFSSIAAIDTTWAVVRDIGNMAFIFVLLYTSIMTIFGKADYRRVITNMVVAALLVNFSLFFTKLIIDAANMIALVFYKAIAPAAQLDPTNFLNGGISNAIMDRLGITNVWAVSQGESWFSNGKNFVIVGVLGSAIQLAAAFSFIAIACMLLVRYVVLIFVLILSPIYFVSKVIPKTSGYASQWEKALAGQAFFAPVYFLLIWISLQVLDGLMLATGKPLSSSLGGTGTYTPDMINSIINFGLVLGFMIFSLIAAKSVSNSAGGIVKDMSQKFTNWGSGAYFGGTLGGLGRNTLGRYGKNRSEDPALIKAAAEGKGWEGARSRMQLALTKKMASGTFDARNMSLPTGVAGEMIEGTVGRTKIGKSLGLNDLNWKNAAVGASLSGQAGTGRGGDRGFKEIKDADNKRLREEEKAQAEETNKAARKLAMEAGIAAAEKEEATRTDEEKAAVKEMLRNIKTMSDKEIEGLKAKTLQLGDVARNLSARNMEKIMGSDRFTDQEKDKILDARFASVIKATEAISNGTAGDAEKNVIKNLSDKEIEMLPENIFDVESNDPEVQKRTAALLKTFSQSQIDGLTKSNKLTVTEKQAIKDARSMPLKTAFEEGATTNNWSKAIEEMSKMGEPALAKLPIGVTGAPSLDNESILTLYTPSILNKLAAQSELNPNKRVAIRTALTNKINSSTTMSSALSALQASPAPNRQERNAILGTLSSEEKKMVLSAEWLESESGQSLF